MFMRSFRWFFNGGLGMSAIISGAVVIQGDRVSPEPTAAVIEGCPAVCGIPCPYQQYYDAFPTHPDYGNYSHVHSDCNMVNCGTGCSQTLDDKAPLSRALALLSSGDRASLEQALREYPAIVHLNIQRHGVQVEGCGGRTVAHVSIDDATLRLLVTE